jgi:hypothetical protein
MLVTFGVLDRLGTERGREDGNDQRERDAELWKRGFD